MNIPTDILEYDRGQFHQWTLNPGDYGLLHPDFESIVETPVQSLKLDAST
ncbi:MAG: hypothetical protein NTW94_04490 [Legionellales bacterium]|nr:hypothetical protein [Legionellales bacterium]